MGVRIATVALGTLGGDDADGDGIADWIAASAAGTNFAFKAAIASPLSPVCVEGAARWPELVAGSFGGTAVTVRPSVAGRWYADLALDPSGSAAPFEVSFENGVRTAAVSVAWVPLDLVTGTTSLNARLGDTLRLGVSQDGSAVLTAVDAAGTVLTVPVAQGVPVDLPLSRAGTWTLTTVWTPVSGAPLTRTLAVHVYGGSLPAAVPACQLGRTRSWLCPDLMPGTKLEAAAGLAVSLSSATNVSLTVGSMYRDHYVALRAGPDGPILDSRRVASFWVQAAVDSYLNVVEIRPTSQVWEGRMLTFGLPADAEIELRIFVGGVTFDDLSVVRRVSGSSLDQAAEYFYRLIHPNSVSVSACHTIKAYQDKVLLGASYNGSVNLPVDLRPVP